MTPTELEAYDAMIADRDRWKERAERLESLFPSGAVPCSACDFRAKVGITLLDAKWLDPACHSGCQSLVIQSKLREVVEAAKSLMSYATAWHRSKKQDAAVKRWEDALSSLPNSPDQASGISG